MQRKFFLSKFFFNCDDKSYEYEFAPKENDSRTFYGNNKVYSYNENRLCLRNDLIQKDKCNVFGLGNVFQNFVTKNACFVNVEKTFLTYFSSIENWKLEISYNFSEKKF